MERLQTLSLSSFCHCELVSCSSAKIVFCHKVGSLQLSMVFFRKKDELYFDHEPILYKLLVKLVVLETGFSRTQQSKSIGLKNVVITITKWSCLQDRQHKTTRESFDDRERAFAFPNYLLLSTMYCLVHSVVCNSP